MIKKWIWLLLAMAVMVGTILWHPQMGHAATTNNRVLLVYDSKNTTNQDQKKIDVLQRTLTAMNLRVKTVKESRYRAGELSGDYVGVITMINWRQANLVNKSFVADREKFTGIKLHIGDNLTDQEVQNFHAQRQVLNQQQFILKDSDDQQLLPFSDHIELLTSVGSDAQTVGQLASQQANQRQYAYGTIVGKNGYLPFLNTSGLGLLLAQQTITQLFGQTTRYQPLLTISNVSPYSNLQVLDQLSRYCYRHQIPFAVSTVSVANNTELKAFASFTSYLRRVEKRDGVVFLQAPVVGGATSKDGGHLSEMFTSYLVSLAKYQVYPIGISAQGYWNQDQVLRHNALQKASHWLLLPNTDVTYLKRDNMSQVATQSFVAVSANSLNTVTNQQKAQFTVPTAVTVKLPNHAKKLAMVEKQISGMHFNWLNLEQAPTNTKIKSGTITVEHRQGQYYLNGLHENITMHDHVKVHEKHPTQSKVLFKSFFKLQGQLIAAFFGIVLLVLLIFIMIGRHIYRNMFKR